MGKKIESFLKEAMKLPVYERARLIEELLTTLETEKEEDVDEAWALEVEKRALELSQDKVRPIIWDEVKEKAVRLANER